jgi:hypothetical protein
MLIKVDILFAFSLKLLIFIFCGLPKEYQFEPKSKAIFHINLISLDIITEYI